MSTAGTDQRMTWVFCSIVAAMFIAPVARAQDGVLTESFIRIPVELINADQNIQISSGIEHSALGTLSASRRSPFKPEMLSKVPANPAPFQVWSYDFIDSYHKLTTDSKFGASVRYGGLFTKVAASINRSTFKFNENKEVLIFAYSSVEVSNRQLPVHEIDNTWLIEDVQSMLEELKLCRSNGNQTRAAEIRRKFAGRYGTGFLANEVRGGVFVAQSRESYSNEQQKSDLKSMVELTVSKTQSAAETSSSKDEQTKVQRLNLVGRTYGGTANISNMDFEKFAEVANKWKETVLTDESQRRILSGDFVPYIAIPALAPLATTAIAPDTSAIIKIAQFGPIESPDAAAIVAVEQSGKWRFQSIPTLSPTKIYIDETESQIRLDVVAYPGFVDDKYRDARQAALTSEKLVDHPDSSMEKALLEASDAPFDGELTLWPVLIIEDGSIAGLRIEPINTPPKVKNIIQTQTYRRNKEEQATSFYFRSTLTTEQIRMLISESRIKLASGVSVDLMDVDYTEAVPILLLDSGSTTQALTVGTARTLTVEEQSVLDRAMETRLLYWQYGPPHRIADAHTGLVWSRSLYAGRSMANDRWCWPKRGDTQGLPSGKASTKPQEPYKNLIAAAPPGMSLVVISARTIAHTESNLASGCLEGNECESHGEGCASVYVDKACYVDTSWLEWYEKSNKARGVPSDKEFMCTAAAQK